MEQLKTLAIFETKRPRGSNYSIGRDSRGIFTLEMDGGLEWNIHKAGCYDKEKDTADKLVATFYSRQAAIDFFTAILDDFKGKIIYFAEGEESFSD